MGLKALVANHIYEGIVENYLQPWGCMGEYPAFIFIYNVLGQRLEFNN